MITRPGPGSHVLVVGCGRSGLAAAKLLRAQGATVTMVDDAPRTALGDAPAVLDSLGVACRFGAPKQQPLPEANVIVVSPGVPTTTDRFVTAVAAGARIVSEPAFASWYCPAPMLAVTGTNGKTTTATLLHHLLCAAGLPSVLAGNVGVAFSGVVMDVRADNVVVLEISSYQLEHAVEFHPVVGAILNVTPDHLDRYGDFDRYVAAKRTLWQLLPDEGLAVANADDPRIAAEARTHTRRLMWFGLDTPEPAAATVENERIVLRRDGQTHAVLPLSDLPLLGRHNVSNALAAVACASEFTRNTEALAEGLRSFTPVPHRLQPVREVAGVLYINDSKATNVSATQTALEAMTRPTVLILGGRGKGAGYRDLRRLIADRVRHVIVLGEDAPQILADLADAAPITEAATFEDAVRAAATVARPGDVVLLSPACASFDMFANFEERGRTFAALVEAL